MAAAQQVTLNVKTVFTNQDSQDALVRVLEKVNLAREMHDTVRPSEIIDDLQTAVYGIAFVGEGPHGKSVLASPCDPEEMNDRLFKEMDYRFKAGPPPVLPKDA